MNHQVQNLLEAHTALSKTLEACEKERDHWRDQCLSARCDRQELYEERDVAEAQLAEARAKIVETREYIANMGGGINNLGSQIWSNHTYDRAQCNARVAVLDQYDRLMKPILTAPAPRADLIAAAVKLADRHLGAAVNQTWPEAIAYRNAKEAAGE